MRTAGYSRRRIVLGFLRGAMGEWYRSSGKPLASGDLSPEQGVSEEGSIMQAEPEGVVSEPYRRINAS